MTSLQARQLAGTRNLVAATFKPNFGGGTFKCQRGGNLEGGMLNKLWKARALCFSAIILGQDKAVGYMSNYPILSISL